MKKTILFLLVIICCLMVSHSQNTVRGRVINAESGLAVEGVTVSTLDKNSNAITNSNGVFKIEKYNKQDTLYFSHLGFEVVKLLPKSGNLEIKISPASIQLTDVVVTGTKSEVARENVPLSVSTISNMEIEESGESALLPVISEKIPGLFVSERGITGFGVSTGAAGQISIRGIGGSPNTQVLILIDGQPQYMGIMGHPLPDSYVASDAQKVEVVRGPASIMYGSGAMGGVINIITKNQNADGYSIKAGTSFGSYNTQKYMATAGYKNKKLSTFISFNHDYTDGHRESSGFDIYNGYAKLSYNISEHLDITTDFNIAKFKTYDPGQINTNDTTFKNNGHWIDIMRGKASLSINNKYDKSNGAIKVFYNFGEHKIYDGFHSKDINTGIIVYQSAELFKNSNVTLGVDYKTFGGIAENILAMQGEGIVFGDTLQSELGVYAIAQQKIFSKLIINAGIRFENHSVFGDEMIHQAGFSYQPVENTTIKGIVSKGFRSPTIRELYLWAPANEDLKPERLMNYEIGIIQKLGNKINLELTGFYIEGENLINTIIVGGLPINMNTGEFYHSGCEFVLNYRPVKNLRINTNYSFLHMETPLLVAPEQQFYLGISYQYKKIRLAVNTQYIDKLYTVTTKNAEKTQYYTLINTRICYIFNDYITVYIAGNNLLNESYEINFDYPMQGTNFVGGLNFSLNRYKE
ncbi:MAG: TonB-dependent receptor [Bacteroidota bacterium]